MLPLRAYNIAGIDNIRRLFIEDDVIEAIIPATHMSQHPSYHVYISALIQ